MALLHPLYLSRATAPSLAAIGIVWGGMAAMVPQIKAGLGISDAELGTLLFLAAIGAVLAMSVAPRLNEWMPRSALPLAGGLMSVAIILAGLASTQLWLFAAGLILVGITTGLLDIIANARIAGLEAEHDAGLMNLNHAAYSFIYAGAAVLTGLAREAGFSTALWFGITGTTALLLLPLIALNPPPAISAEERIRARGPIPPAAIIAGIIAMVGFFSENATEHWSALHIERTLGQGAALGALGPAMLGLTMGIGRLAGHFVTRRGREIPLLGGAVAMSASGLFIAAIAPAPWVAYLGFGLLGLGVSVVAPLALSIAGRSSDEAGRARAVARATMISYGGFFFGPPVMGFLAEFAGLRAAFGIVALVLLVVPLVLLRKLPR